MDEKRELVTRPIRLDRLTEDLDPDDALTALAVAMEDVAIATSLSIIHGRTAGAARYVEAGGRLRFDADGEPVILWSTDLRHRKVFA